MNYFNKIFTCNCCTCLGPFNVGCLAIYVYFWWIIWWVHFDNLVLFFRFIDKMFCFDIKSYRNLQAQLISIIHIINTFYLYLDSQSLHSRILVQMRKLIFIHDTFHETNVCNNALIYQVLFLIVNVLFQ